MQNPVFKVLHTLIKKSKLHRDTYYPLCQNLGKLGYSLKNWDIYIQVEIRLGKLEYSLTS